MSSRLLCTMTRNEEYLYVPLWNDLWDIVLSENRKVFFVCTQRLLELLGWESFEKSSGLQDSWWWGSQLQPPSLGLTPLQTTSPSTEWSCRN